MVTIQLRPAALADLPDMCALTNRAEAAAGVPRVQTVEELQEELDVPYIDLGLDTRVALHDDELVGLAWIWNPPSDDAEERAHLVGEVDPARRGLGIGRALLEWSVDRAEERLRGRSNDLPKYVRVDAYEWLEANHRLYARFGFAPVRWFADLLRPLAPRPVVPVPDGIAIEPWPNDRAEEIRLVRNQAFADHWGSTPVDADRWDRSVHGHGSRLDLSAIAVDTATGEVVALCLNAAYPEDDEVTGRREAWIGILGTARAWRHRGVASALIAWSVAAFDDAGFSHAALGVDTDNPTGAARLYRDLGFEPMRRSVTHQIQLT